MKAMGIIDFNYLMRLCNCIIFLKIEQNISFRRERSAYTEVTLKPESEPMQLE